MKMWKIALNATVIMLFAGQATAQSEEKAQHEAEARKAEYSERLREAEERMEEAARQIAEITRERLPKMEFIERRMEFSNRPRIGITIESDSDSGAVEGVEVGGVSPGSAADESGLRAGDLITAVNGESMSAESCDEANKLLLDFMQGVEEGDKLKVDYLRNGNSGSVELAPKVVEMHAFSWAPDGEDFHIESIPGVPHIMKELKIERGFPFIGSAWGRMELVELSEGLGRYFGTDSGLLVVNAPEADGVDLQDGDVIQSIDDREPKDVRHAMRILGSYQSGETLKLGIMRDKKKRTLDVVVPENHHGSLFEPPAAKPARAPVPPKPPLETAST